MTATSGRVLVVGSLNADVVATTATLPGPGETVMGRDVVVLPGGKGCNQAVAAARAGAPTSLAGCIGDDGWGDVVHDFLAATEIDARHVVRVETTTGVALVTVDRDGENAIVVVPGANHADELVRVAGHALERLSESDVLLCQVEVPASVVEGALSAARAVGAVTILNVSPASEVTARCLELADVVIANEHEARQLALPRARRPGQVVVKTQGGGVVCVWDDDASFTVPVPATQVVDSTGAGDCFAGVLAARLAAGGALRAAVADAVAAATLQVTRLGAAVAMPTAAEIAGARV